MRIGPLNRRITIQRQDTAEDEYGEPIPGAWVDVAPVWANIAHKSGLETVKSGVDVSIVQASIRIRYREDITAGMRVVHKSTVYDIRGVLPDESGREFVDLVCQTGANQG
ncbi:phage head closure protein [Allopusillimonas ginsengisoli]|uniref:phage head closure protein n=1 Tax=Allopusillimonas ginsengisoli TaxID=453575 RepID=UPI00101EBA20|nr:phage head closure protein [Allopusillimonas ginsengisoli]TEA79833.1 head-tail adaptor protein [Allopusillimonas ginsengisoli]